MSHKEMLLEVPMFPEYDFGGKKGKIHTIREVEIPPLGTTVVKGIADLTTHSKNMRVVVEPVTGYA